MTAPPRTPPHGSHLPVLIRAVLATRGPVLELGTGDFSTPVLHWLCSPARRPLVSYENNLQYYAKAHRYADDWHRVVHVASWDQAEIDQRWDVALIDHGPAERRIRDIQRLAARATLIVVHDTESAEYRYSDVFPMFTYHWANSLHPQTSVLSQSIDVGAMPWN